MNTFSKKLVTFLSTLMGVGLIYVAVLMFVGQTSTNTYYKDSNNAVQKVMADLNFYQSNNGGESLKYGDTGDVLRDTDGYTSKNYPLSDVFSQVLITQDLATFPPVTLISENIPTPIRRSH